MFDNQLWKRERWTLLNAQTLRHLRIKIEGSQGPIFNVTVSPFRNVKVAKIGESLIVIYGC